MSVHNCFLPLVRHVGKQYGCACDVAQVWSEQLTKNVFTDKDLAIFSVVSVVSLLISAVSLLCLHLSLPSLPIE